MNKPPVSLADYLLSRRDAILQSWRISCDQDIALKHVVILDRREFDDHVPMLLQVLEQRLSRKAETESPVSIAHDHGFHRWRRGRGLNEILVELDYLYAILHREVLRYQELFFALSPTELAETFVEISRIKEETIRGSIGEYLKQEQRAADRRIAGLDRALMNLNQLGRDRNDLLRTSSHDLKSGFGIIQGVTTLLEQEDSQAPERGRLFEILKRNLVNLQNMLGQLTDLSRLEAGKETLQLTKFDASLVLREIISGMEPLAEEKGLKLLAEGSDKLMVTGDKIKLSRIVQNLLINSVKYTDQGLISVAWSSVDNFRWYIGVQDSGRGLPAEVVNLMGGILQPITEITEILDPDAAADALPEAPESSLEEDVPQISGEGLGLHIVKNLCDLMQADLAVETVPGKGTLFSIRMPFSYE